MEESDGDKDGEREKFADGECIAGARHRANSGDVDHGQEGHNDDEDRAARDRIRSAGEKGSEITGQQAKVGGEGGKSGDEGQPADGETDSWTIGCRCVEIRTPSGLKAAGDFREAKYDCRYADGADDE